MKNIRITWILAGFVFAFALGAAAVWWLEHRDVSVTSPPDATAHEDAGQADEHGHSAEGHGSDEHGHEDGAIVLSEKAIKDSGIEVAPAAGGELEESLSLPGEIVLNADKVAHIVPRVAGIVHRVDKKLGDEVQAGEIMAILESRELAEAKATFLAAQERLTLAQATLESAEQLRAKRIMPDLEFLAIQKAQAEAEIESKAVSNKLHALGMSEEQLKDIPGHAASLALSELRAPFAGTVVEKHCSLGEVLDSETDAFVLADLSTVWAQISVYTQDVARVRVGQAVQIRAETPAVTADGTICYLSPLANEATRTVSARVDLANAERQWRPGTFVTASITLERRPASVLVPLEALQRVKGDNVVFVADADGFEPRVVQVGRVNSIHAEITGGLQPGEQYVTKGAVILKAELGKREAVHVH